MNENKRDDPSPATMDSLLPLVRDVELQSVRFVHLSARSDFPAHRPSGSLGELTSLLGWEAHPVSTELPNSIVIRATGHFGITEDPKQTTKPDAEAHLTIELVYKVPPDFEISEEQKTAFAQVNGVFNAWPFFRAQLFGLFPSMGLPPYTLPVYRVPGGVAVPKEAPKEEDSAKLSQG